MMPIFKRKPSPPIEANQYRAGERTPGVEFGLDGAGLPTAFVTTIQGQQVRVLPGEWIVKESDGTHFYPINDATFRQLYEPVDPPAPPAAGPGPAPAAQLARPARGEVDYALPCSEATGSDETQSAPPK